MANIIRLVPDQMTELEVKARNLSLRYNELNSETQALIDYVSHNWEGESAVALVNEIRSLCLPEDKRAQALLMLAKILAETRDAYLCAESELSSKIGGLFK